MPRVESPAVLAEVFDWLASAKRAGVVEQRSELRHALPTPAELTPLDAAMRQCGPTCHGVVRDFSRRGIGLYVPTRVTAPFLGVRLLLPRKRVAVAAVEVLRCVPFGSLFQVGGRLLGDESAASG